MKISVSRLKCFKSCMRMYQLKYIEGLEPVQKADALEVGSNYHELIEHLYKTGTLEDAGKENSKELAMAMAYQKHILPRFKMTVVEEWFEKPIPGTSHILVGRVDGVAEDGYLVEHKTTGADNLEEYEFDLQWDEQILAYMYAYGVRRMWYTVIRKPTIRLKKNESEEEFFSRMVAWYDEDTDSKIRLIEIERTDEQVSDFAEELAHMSCDMAEKESNFYRNTSHCKCWGRRCEYSSICLHYDPNINYVEFLKREEKENETRENG